MPRSDKAKSALASFKRRIVYLGIAGGALVVVSVTYLGSNGPLTATMVAAVTIGVFVSVVLGGGLMAAGFFSASSGIDDDVSKASIAAPDADVDVANSDKPSERNA